MILLLFCFHNYFYNIFYTLYFNNNFKVFLPPLADRLPAMDGGKAWDQCSFLNYSPGKMWRGLLRSNWTRHAVLTHRSVPIYLYVLLFV
jgi:hypothetical protein